MPKAEGVRDMRSLPPAQYSDPFQKTNRHTEKERGGEWLIYEIFQERKKIQAGPSEYLYIWAMFIIATFMWLKY